MAKKLNEVAPQKPLFEGHEKVEKKDIIDIELTVLGYSVLNGDDGRYGVIAFRTEENKLLSCTINNMMLERLEEAVEKIGLNDVRSTKKELYLSEPISVTIKAIESQKNKNRTYYVFE